MTGALLADLVDDAGLFPPTALPMAAALERHRADLAAGDPMLTHRFLCPAARLGELRGLLTADDRIRVGVILSDGAPHDCAAVVDADPRLRLALIETPCTLAAVDRVVYAATAPGVPVYVEAADRDEGPRLAAALAGTSAGLKIRCGGVRAELFPSAELIAAALVAAAEAGVPVKATAGLHHAVRHTDPATGFLHHGYLNLVVAAARAAAGAGAAEVAAAVLVTDGEALASEAAALGPDATAATRSLFVAYGSCSTATPVDEAAALGLSPAVGAAAHGRPRTIDPASL
ncbi:hypothetical protein [Tsukamurella sp. 1534]|uniref:hypothetical protein n=1 Tax=Tsukamurella sp. 1534 TaxID=1151061 RepID=UPI0002D2E5DB|nr:hypothetical protein [Tsukamurella sp. 1534]